MLAITIPKSGTHLLTAILEALPGVTAWRRGVLRVPGGDPAALRHACRRMPAGTYVATHIGCSAPLRAVVEDLGLQAVLLVRDPRDVAASMVRFAMTAPHVPEHPAFAALPDDGARLRAAIGGHPGTPGPGLLRERYDRYLPWRAHGALLLRYEDLVGPRGGGTVERQHAAIRRLAAHLDLPATDAQISAAAAYSTATPTFRRGQIGGWRQDFDEAHIALAHDVLGDVIADLGYDLDTAPGGQT